jgi:DNA-binding LacI/PurR family transcriptional regulator
MPGVVPLVLGMEGFILRALDYFRARGRTRVALLAVPGHDGRFYDHFAAGLEQRGMGTRPYWIQLINQNAAVGARNAVHLLMNPDQVVRPDALLVSDDNLVEYASAGLIAAGIRVPEDCDVVAHCNFPWPTPSVMPVRRLGYDARRMLQLAIGEIDRQRAGGAASPRLDLAAQFEDEVQARLPVRR